MADGEHHGDGFAGCHQHAVAKDLCGTYVAEYSFGRETLPLKDDGTYTQEITIGRPAKPTVNSGKWKYDGAAEMITLENCLAVSDGVGGLNKDYQVAPPANCILPVERQYFWSGRIRLGPDEGNPYWKM